MRWAAARDPGVEDDIVWTALVELTSADAPSTDRAYLYQQVDFEAWRDALDAG